MNIGNAIKTCRTRRNISRAKLAEVTGFSVSYLSLLERNKRDPNISTLEKISDALDVPVPLLMFLASDKKEMSSISPEVAEKLSYIALKSMELKR